MWWEGSRLFQRAGFKIWSSEGFSIFHSCCPYICRMWRSSWISASFCATATISVLPEFLGCEYFSFSPKKDLSRQNCFPHSFSSLEFKVRWRKGWRWPSVFEISAEFNCQSSAFPCHLEAVASLQNMDWCQENTSNHYSNIWLLLPMHNAA